MKPPSFARAALRGPFAVLLAVLLAAAAGAQPPAGAQPKKEPDKKDADKKEPAKPPEVKWPTEVGGKDLAAWLKDAEDPDPAVREFAVRTLPGFGPAAQKGAASKLLIKRMKTVNERDPGVRMAVFNTVGLVQFENDADTKEAVRLLVESVREGQPGGMTRLTAVQTLSMFGPKGSGGITALTTAIGDPSYQTRQSIASALGRVGFNEETGPNMLAMRALAGTLAKDSSAAVRTEALQSLMLLGPPWAAVMKAGAKQPPPINTKDAAEIVRLMRARVGDPAARPPVPAAEKDKQVEIWARLVLMRFDPKEVNDENLDAFARHLGDPDIGVKLQALQAMGIMGELASKKLTDVVRVLNDKTMPRGLTATTINVLTAMGAGAKPAVPDLKKLAAETKAAAEKKTGDEKAADEQFVKLIDAAIKHIEEAKPIGSAPGPGDPKKP